MTARASYSRMAGRPRRVTVAIYAILILGTAIVGYPFFYLALNAIKPGVEIINYPLRLPSRITLAGFETALEQLRVGRLYLNTIYYAGTVTVLNVALDSLAAFALAKLRFVGRNLILSVMLGSLMLPSILLLVPTYLIMHQLGWVGSFKALIVPGAVSVYNIFLLRQFIIQIPDELLEAARIDGASDPRIFLSIILPLIRPSLVTVAILSFMGAWNDFFGPVLYLFNNQDLWTVQLGLYQFNAGIRPDYQEALWAGTAAVTFPLLLLYFLLQDQFIAAFATARLD